MITSFDSLIKEVKRRSKKNIAIAGADGADILQAASNAHQQGLADAILIGKKQKIVEISEENQVDISAFDIVNANSENQAVIRAIQMVREGLADTMMKGTCSTATLLKGVLDREHGVRTGKLLSHVAVLELPKHKYHKLLFMSDGGMNISPNTEAKVAIIENALNTARSFKIRKPKVAIITAVEKVNYSAMPCTVDAAILTKMAERGQIKNCIIDGPLALDNAISKKACEIKGIKSPINGEADILIMPDIESGNIFYKALNFLGECRTAGIVVGAKVPIIVASRSDTEENKFLSIALALMAS